MRIVAPEDVMTIEEIEILSLFLNKFPQFTLHGARSILYAIGKESMRLLCQ